MNLFSVRVSNRIAVIGLVALYFSIINALAQTASAAKKMPFRSTHKGQKITALLQHYHLIDQFDGTWLIAENDKTIYKGAVGWADRTWNIPNKVDTKFGLASNVKQFVGALIMQLVEQGEIRLEGKITDYLPEYPQESGDRITIHHLLTHTSGIPNYTLFEGQWAIHYFNYFSPAEYVKRFSEKALEFAPGSRFNYNNSGYYILGMIIERLTGKSFEQALADNLLTPLNISQSGCLRKEVIPGLATSYETQYFSYQPFRFDYTGDIATGDMYSTVEDVYKWQRAFFLDQFLTAASRQKMIAAHVLDTTRSIQRRYYGYGLGTMKLAKGPQKDSVQVVYHTGGLGYSSLIMRLPEEKHSIILLSNVFNPDVAERINWPMLYQAIINILYDEPYTLPQPKLKIALRNEIKAKGVARAIARFAELKKTSLKLKDEWELNDLGYFYLVRKLLPEAIEVFKLNVQEYPKLANGYDSLGEAYEKNGNKVLAIQNYEKALALEPSLLSSRATLKRLQP